MNLRKPKYLLFSIGLLGWLGSLTQIMAPAEDKNLISSSKSAKAPLQYKARADFEKAKYFLGENAMLNFRIENIGKDPITLETGGDYRGTVRATRFQVKAVAEDGSVAPDPHPDAALYCEGGLGGGQKLNYSQHANFSVSLPLYARIEKPGKYKVSVSHDFGWGLPADKRPTGTTEKLSLSRPPAEARKLVEEIYKEAQLKTGARRDDAYDDVSDLSYPVYLQPLLERVVHGGSKEAESALNGIGNIASIDATNALLKIGAGNNKKLAILAAGKLVMRLPDPELKGDLPRRNVFEVSYDPERRHLVKTSWQDSFAPEVCELGKNLLNSSDKEEQQVGAFMLQCVGDADSLKSVVSALDAAIRKSKTLPFESQMYPRPRGNVAELMRTATVLAKRGSVSENPQNPGECAMYMTLISKDAKFRPADWQTRYLGFFKNDVPYIRELALTTVPTPLPPTFIPEIAQLLKDPDVDVQIAACQLTAKVKGDTFKKDLQFVLANAKEQWLINAASNSLSPLDRVECLRILASKFDDPKLMQDALSQFIPGIVQAESWGSRSGLAASGDDDDMAVAGKRIKTLWLKFIKDDEAFLRGGGMIKPGDPRITADYLPHSMSLGQVNGKEWPSLKAKDPSTTNLQDKAVQDRLVQKVKGALPPKWQVKSTGTGLPDGWICSNKSPCFRVTISDGKSDNAIWYVPANWIAIRKAKGNNIPGGVWNCINGNATMKVMCQQAEYKFMSENFRSMLPNGWTTSLINSGFGLSQQIFAGKEQEADQKALQLVNENCKSAEEVNAAAISLIELGVPAKQVFLKAAREGKGDTTWLISALRLVGGKDVAPVFLKMLGDPDSTDLVRQRSAQALEEMGQLNNAVPLLTKAMQVTKSEESLSALAKVLASTGSPQAGKAIFDAFNRTQNPCYKIELGDMLAGLHYREASSALQKLESEIDNSRDGNLSGGTHFVDWQLQEMKQRIKSSLKRLAES